VQLQYAVDAALIHVLSTATTRFNVSDYAQAFLLRFNESLASRLRMFPDPPHRDDDYVQFINDYFPIVLLVSFMLVVASICKDLVLEKEKKLKVYATLCVIYCTFCYRLKFITQAQFNVARGTKTVLNEAEMRTTWNVVG